MMSFSLRLAALLLLLCSPVTADLKADRIERHCRQLKKDMLTPGGKKALNRALPGRWWMAHWDPNWSCPKEEKIGLPNKPHSQDGDKWVCDTDQIKHSACIVYSFGSNGNYVFETGIQNRFGCEIHTFDPTALGDVHTDTTTKAGLHVHPWGIDSTTNSFQRSNKDGTLADEPPLQMKTLPDIVQELGHERKEIDILKIDVEGFEFGVLDNPEMWAALKETGTTFSQILVEVHLSGVNRKSLKWKPGPSLYDGATMDGLFRQLSAQGYGMFHKEVNVLPEANLQCTEFGFAKIDVDCLDPQSSKVSSKFVY